MGDDELEMREKYPWAVYFLESAIDIICEGYPLKVYGPPHDVAGAILAGFFIEEEKPCQG